MDERELLGDAPIGRLSGYKILVVDDDEEIRIFLTTLFEDEGAAVFEAEDGDGAISQAGKSAPDLITLDVSMPGKNGVEAFTELREDPSTEEIPVCIITGHPEFRQVIYDRPVTPPEGFINKPCDPDHVVETLHRILTLVRKRKERAGGAR
ncbi:MAG: response regulator [Holophagae bacterium]|jgi:two-component system chemotaxis response regulator CheY